MQIFVVSIGASYEYHAMPMIERYCERYSYSLSVLRESHDSSVPASWNKLVPFRTCGDVPFVLVLDLDCIPMPHADPIHEALDFTRVNMVRQRLTRRRVRRMQRRGTKIESNSRWNSGLVGLPLSMRDAWESLWEKRRELNDKRLGYEQEHLNRMIDRNSIDVHSLEPTWNALAGKRFAPHTSQVQFAHFAGVERTKRDGIKNLYRHMRRQDAKSLRGTGAQDH